MHEFSIAQSICDIVNEEAGRHRCRRVVNVACRIGALRQVVPDLLETAFEMTAKGTVCEDATLGIETEPITVVCGACGRRAQVKELVLSCPVCHSLTIRFEGGGDIFVTSITAEQEDADEDHRAA